MVFMYFFLKFTDECIMPRCFKSVNNFYKKLKMKLFWNAVLRALIEQYMPICVTVMQSVQKGNNWDNFETSINSLSNYVFMPYIIGYPIWILWFLRRNRFQLSDRNFIGRYNSLYLNVDYFKFGGLPNTTILITRRFVFAFNAIYFSALSYSSMV